MIACWLRCSAILAAAALIATEAAVWALTGRSQFYGMAGPGALLTWYACASLALGALLSHVERRAP